MSTIIVNSTCFQQQDLAEERAKEITKEFRKNILPRGFFLDEEGVWFQPEPNKNGDPVSPVYICSPLEVTAIVRDHANENHGRLLEFPDVDGLLHTWAMPMELLAGDGTRYREELLNKGLLTGVGRRPKELLTEYIQLCQPVMRARCVLQTGWCKNAFVLPNETIGPPSNEKLLYQSVSSHHFGYDCGGSLEEWKKMAALCNGNSRLIFAISSGFASPFLHLLGEENGGFHFRGPSSTGKTTVLKVAASVWGSPEFLQRWRATANGLEGMASAHNDALLCLDEIEQMHPNEISEVAYMIPNGTGKVRADRHGSARKRVSWRLLFLSTGEISLAEHILQGGRKVRAGHEVRIIDVPADTEKYGIFEELHGFPDAAAFADHLTRSCQQHYGMPSREFLKHLVANREAIIKEARGIIDSLRKRVLPKGATGQVIRGFHRFALIAAAGEIATMYGITGWEVGAADFAAMKCFNDWLRSRGDTGMQEERIALSQVKKFFEMHSESRFSSWDRDPMENKTINRAGFKKMVDEEIEFYVFKETFKAEICAGLDHVFVAKVCVQHELLLPAKDGCVTRAERFPGNKNTTQCYRFTSKVLCGD